MKAHFVEKHVVFFLIIFVFFVFVYIFFPVLEILIFFLSSKMFAI